jgi:signal transduction histidine kinase
MASVMPLPVVSPEHRPTPRVSSDAGRRIAPPQLRRITRFDDPLGLEYLVEFAHDVRGPLSAISSLSYALHSGLYGKLSDEQADRVALVQGATRGLARLVEDLTTLARPQAALQRVQVGLFDVDDILKCVYAVGRPMVEGRGIHLVMRNYAPKRYTGPAGIVTRVMLNLVTNAVRFTDAGAVLFGARVIEPTGDLEFFVRDTGRGDLAAAPAVPARQLTPSTWTPEPNPLEEHSGLSLMICRRLLEAIGSKLEIDSRVGEGDVFRFCLRLQPVA